MRNSINANTNHAVIREQTNDSSKSPSLKSDQQVNLKSSLSRSKLENLAKLRAGR